MGTPHAACHVGECVSCRHIWWFRDDGVSCTGVAVLLGNGSSADLYRAGRCLFDPTLCSWRWRWFNRWWRWWIRCLCSNRSVCNARRRVEYLCWLRRRCLEHGLIIRWRRWRWWKRGVDCPGWRRKRHPCWGKHVGFSRSSCWRRRRRHKLLGRRIWQRRYTKRHKWSTR